MLILITGGSKSGKSLMAENIISSYSGKKYYIATMEPFSDEAKNAIERHRKMRAGKGFETIEKYRDIETVQTRDDAIVLLECMGNLCANEMFSKTYNENVSDKISNGIKKLSKRHRVLIVVTNEVFADGVEYPHETMCYIKNMGEINRKISEYADVVIESIYGIPLVLKGKWMPSWKGKDYENY